MPTFKQHYQKLFDTLGQSLTKAQGVPATNIMAAEKRIGVKIPAALREYYLVAGREKRLNHCLNRLLPPQDWRIDKQRLIFMEENQSVVWWGASIRTSLSSDPPVYQGINQEPIAWYLEHRKCSVFLSVILHYHAVSGGLKFCGRGYASDETDYRFERNGWQFHGRVNGLAAYSRKNQSVCLMPPGDLPFMQKWSVFAGANSSSELQSIGTEIGVKLD
jgi:hypothetical protein